MSEFAAHTSCARGMHMYMPNQITQSLMCILYRSETAKQAKQAERARQAEQAQQTKKQAQSEQSMQREQSKQNT